MALSLEGSSCPVCGIALNESDLDAPDGDYFCPYCCTELRPPSRTREASFTVLSP
jgi:uncharacterized Zn finger protein (UPF0148 family)